MGLFSRKVASPAGLLISGHVSVWLVGTDHYPDAYRDAKDGQPVYLELRAESDNPHDANAIAGLVDGKVGGYLPKEVAEKYRNPIEGAAALGFRLFVATEFSKRYRKGNAKIGLGWLDLPRQDALAKWLALPSDERAKGFDFQMTASANTPHSVGRPVEFG
jgi:hypothetical protein